MRKHKHSAGVVIGGIGLLFAGICVSCVDSAPWFGSVGTLVGLALALVGAAMDERGRE